jgi:transcription initiation factor TFIIH subunit 1
MVSQSPQTIYEPVLHKKTSGKIVLSQGTFQFQITTPDNGDSSSNNNDNNNHGDNNDNAAATTMVELSWNKIAKHQVSPASHTKSLLKVVLIEGAGKPLTFQLSERYELERIRKDITERLKDFLSQHSSLLQSFATPSKNSNSSSSNSANAGGAGVTASGTKRKWNGGSCSSSSLTNGRQSLLATGKTSKTTFGELDPTSLAVTRSSLLASNPTLRSQHKYLVEESNTVSEDDFWNTHRSLLEEEYARISGIARAGTSSLLQSHLQVLTGRITLGVEEMRQIFIMYQAVHKAYEEKVPLELSDEQFWRKYLESEYFHRDRGRVGAASGRQHANSNYNPNHPDNTASGVNASQSSKQAKANADAKDQEARAAVAAADDLFSRYDQKLRESGQLDDGVFSTGTASGFGGGPEWGGDPSKAGGKQKHKWGTNLAIGQFDLASTFETERGNLLEGPRDNHPHNTGMGGEESNNANTIGAKVIQKYNRHWAMVLNPEEAVAGSNLVEVARNSVQDAIPNDSDAMAGGGLDDEMQRLVGFANANAKDANHALGVGESDEYEVLTLKNVDVYFSNSAKRKSTGTEEDAEATRKKNAQFANYMVGKTKLMVEAVKKQQSGGVGSSSTTTQLEDAFPPPIHGRDLLKALTKRMAQDSITDADTLEVVNSLPVNFKKRLHSYFRRTSELLRHFFGLRKLALEAEEAIAANNGNGNDNGGSSSDQHSIAYNQKLKKIVTGLETLYNEIGDMRKQQEVTGTKGKIMGRMCFQIMEQLDWAFKCYREGTNTGSSGSSSGGFTTIETF